MIAYLSGIIIYRDNEKSSIIVENNGVGYEVFIPAEELGFLNMIEGKTISLFIYTYVREDRLTLYGFNTSLQREIFSLLLDVKDVGPRLAVTVLSGINANNFLNIITTQDISALSQIKGIGKAKAERIIMELKNKILKKPSLMNDIRAQDLRRYKNKIANNAGQYSDAEETFKSGCISDEEETIPSNSGAGLMDAFNQTANANINSNTNVILESVFTLEALGYSRAESFNIAGKVYKNIKNTEEEINLSTEELTKHCLKYIYELKNKK